MVVNFLLIILLGGENQFKPAFHGFCLRLALTLAARVSVRAAVGWIRAVATGVLGAPHFSFPRISVSSHTLSVGAFEGPDRVYTLGALT